MNINRILGFQSDEYITAEEEREIYENIMMDSRQELERLQTVPEGYVDNVPGISENMKANLLGDGWTVDVIAHIFSFLK